jgi:hypothetical protein
MMNLRTALVVALCTMAFTAAAIAGGSCKRFQGEFDGGVRGNSVAGFVSGDLPGRMVGTLDAIDEPLGPTTVRGKSALYARGGMIKTDDVITLVPSKRHPRILHWKGTHTIRGGDRGYRGATGVMYSEGKLDLRTGKLTYQFRGQICKPR